MNNLKPKILFVLTRSPFPATDGTRERILGEIKALGDDFQISLFIISDEDITLSSKKYLQNIITGEIYIIKLSKINCYLRSFISLFSNYPIQSAYFYNLEAIKWLQQNGDNYKAINFYTIRFGKYITYLKKNKLCINTRLLLSFNDAISLNYKNAIKKAKGLWRLIYLIEVDRIKNYELLMLTTADGFSIVSERDKKYIENNWKEKYLNEIVPAIQVIRHGIDDTLFNYNYDPQTNNLVFIGNLYYLPNRQGLSFFCKNIWPLVLIKKPETKFLIIGRGGKEYLQNTPGLEILGFVDDPYQLMINQALFISPADFGAGVPTKSLLAMALGLPVISTINNALGIEDVIDNENICLINYDKCEQAAEKIISLLNNEENRKKIGLTGKKLVSEKYRQSINYPILKSFINGKN